MKRLLLALLLSLIAGCTGQKAAFKAADDQPDKLAYVVAEEYAALLHEAADLKEQGLPANVVAKLQQADDVAKPLILQLKPLAESYKEVNSVENEAALRTALGKAAVAISAFIDAVKEARR